MLKFDEILKRPLITEKSTLLREKNKYVIEVAPNACKGDIRIALETRFKVSVTAIKTIKIRGKFRRKNGPVGGYQTNRKKAIVSLKPGQQIKWEEVA